MPNGLFINYMLEDSWGSTTFSTGAIVYTYNYLTINVDNNSKVIYMPMKGYLKFSKIHCPPSIP